MHLGIDLGTTNSVLAAFDGSAVSLIPNASGETLTPSVVRIDARGNVTVGRRAFRHLETDPANTRGEFKRLMGTGERIAFDASGQSFLPEQLSAQVLGALLGDARDALGWRPRAAVISTPALFELPQNHATVQAGELAGLEEIALIQEPVASAIAAGWRAEDADGLWLVYDLGGGTLDVSLLETKDGWLRVVDHSGDNFLGGKDFDNALVDWALGRLRGEQALPDLARTNPAQRRVLGKLKAACEQTRIELSRAERAAISCPELCLDAHGDPVDVDLEISRRQLEGLIAPLVERSLEVCRHLLAQARVTPEAIERVVFVGGPTLTPAVRQGVGGLFGGRVAEGADPMTLVARGAALYAATAGLDARPKAAAPAALAGLAVRLEYPAVTSDSEPFVVGRFLPASGEALPARVRIERADGGFVSPETAVSEEGSFLLQVRLERHQRQTFRLAALDARGEPVALQAAEIAIVHGMSVADPPLSRSVGVARSDDTVHLYFEKGTPLPARRTVAHQTVQAVAAGSSGDALLIPVIQGESKRAHRNRLIGSLQLSGRGLRQAIPAGTRVEVTLHLDRSGRLQARADLPSIGQSFEDVVHVLVPSASVEVLAGELAQAEERLNELRRRAFRSSLRATVQSLAGADGLLAEARAALAAAQGDDRDAAQRLQRLLLDLQGHLDAAEEAFHWPELEAEAEDKLGPLLSWIGAHGTPAEQQLSERALAALVQARERRDAGELERQLEAIRALANTAFARDPEAPLWSFEWYEENFTQAADVPKAQQLLDRGRKARERNDLSELRAINRQLDPLYGGSVEERRRSFGSGVQ